MMVIPEDHDPHFAEAEIGMIPGPASIVQAAGYSLSQEGSEGCL